jgi:hypothetical protein
MAAADFSASRRTARAIATFIIVPISGCDDFADAIDDVLAAEPADKRVQSNLSARRAPLSGAGNFAPERRASARQGRMEAYRSAAGKPFRLQTAQA